MGKITAENFKSLEHLIISNQTRPYNAVFATEHKSITGDKGFMGTQSYEEAVYLLRNGYNDPLDKIKRGVETNIKSFKSEKTSVKNDIVGYAPCVPNAILGIPQSMVNKDAITKKAKVLTIYYDIEASAFVTTKTFIEAGIAVLTIINSLETRGYRVALNLVFYNASAGDDKCIATVNLKEWRQPIDIKKMAFPFCNASMLRRIGFRWLETHPDIENEGWRMGYGTPLRARHSCNEISDYLIENKIMDKNDKFINMDICEKHNFDPQAIAKECGLK